MIAVSPFYSRAQGLPYSAVTLRVGTSCAVPRSAAARGRIPHDQIGLAPMVTGRAPTQYRELVMRTFAAPPARLPKNVWLPPKFPAFEHQSYRATEYTCRSCPPAICCPRLQRHSPAPPRLSLRRPSLDVEFQAELIGRQRCTIARNSSSPFSISSPHYCDASRRPGRKPSSSHSPTRRHTSSQYSLASGHCRTICRMRQAWEASRG